MHAFLDVAETAVGAVAIGGAVDDVLELMSYCMCCSVGGGDFGSDGARRWRYTEELQRRRR